MQKQIMGFQIFKNLIDQNFNHFNIMCQGLIWSDLENRQSVLRNLVRANI